MAFFVDYVGFAPVADLARKKPRWSTIDMFSSPQKIYQKPTELVHVDIHIICRAQSLQTQRKHMEFIDRLSNAALVTIRRSRPSVIS